MLARPRIRYLMSSKNTTHVTRVVSALVNAVRFITATRGMRCTDAVVQRFVDAFGANELLLDDAPFATLCAALARYLCNDDDVPPTMAALAEAMEPLVFVSIEGAVRHRGVVEYDCLFLTFCAEDTAVLAKRVAALSERLLAACQVVRETRRRRAPVGGRIVFVHANERNYDAVPPVAKAAAISGKRLIEGITLEFFYAAELQFDRLAHQEVPDHMPLDVLLDNADANAALRAELERDELRGWRIALREPFKLPVIKREDIIARLFGFRAGQLVRIETRDLALGGTTFEYHQIV